MAVYNCAACGAEIDPPFSAHTCDEGETVATIEVTPEWNNTAAFTATALRDHEFQRGAAEPVVSLIEMVRYLAVNDPPAIERLIARVQRAGR